MDTKQNLLDTVKKLHFVGIGGSGMCPMAEILHHKGYILTGSDMNESDTLERIRGYGIPVSMGHRAENIGDAEVVVYTAACKSDNPELVAAREKGIPTLERSVMLGILTEKFPFSIAVSGTHGKTTTTGMLTQILMEAGKDPSAIIGGKLPLIGGNGRVGKSGCIVCEACEYVDTFLQLHPAVSVLLNIDADHLDYFKTVDNIVKSFHQFATQTSQMLVVNGDDQRVMKSVSGLSGQKIVTFGRSDKNDYYPAELNEEDTACEDFTLMFRGERLGRVNLAVPGEHNMMNAIAAAAAAHSTGVDPEAICSALGHFTGVHRRFEVLGKFGGVTVADDFAHHPTELSAVLSSAMRMGYREVWAVFQPHTYSRTYNLLEEFSKALAIPDHLVMTEILAVRESNTYNIHTSDLAAKIPGSVWFNSFEEIADYVMDHAKSGDLILTLGGGDIYKCANLIVQKYQAGEK
ncbi:UDP-N-acetylmuramate--L-alanine ligase [uncultured Neglectibacter sp.]|uniref:UDP-N-acetylmuramate--L-alanine ligase n=1 Tax=uncultured Neglectibacter sp. TaxID=1924108 RepID=UPI0034DEFE2F